MSKAIAEIKAVMHLDVQTLGLFNVDHLDQLGDRVLYSYPIEGWSFVLGKPLFRILLHPFVV